MGELRLINHVNNIKYHMGLQPAMRWRLHGQLTGLLGAGVTTKPTSVVVGT